MELTPKGKGKGKGKAIPLQDWTGTEGSRRLRLPAVKTSAHEGGKVVSPTHRPLLPSGNIPGIHFFQRLSQPQDQYVNEKIQ
jgi:hypothetical protein